MTETKSTQRVSWAPPPPPNRKRQGCGLALLLIPVFFIAFLGLLILLAGGRTNILILGLDSRELGSDLGRSDTMILSTFVPRQPYLGMLSIPRDLWVSIPNYGENRINTAHFFAEADIPGSGPDTAIQTVQQNFGVDVHYYLRIRFDGFLDLVDLIGGVDINLPVAMAGYPAGTHHLNGEQALAFVRDRAGSDDFFRMQRSQIFIKALWTRFLHPSIWRQLPQIIPLLLEMVDTDIPLTKWPFIAITILRVGPAGIDPHVITRELTNPFSTPDGAQVLAPDWLSINPLVRQIFKQ